MNSRFSKQGLLASFIHISDLHFGNKFTVNESILKNIVSKIPKAKGLLCHCYVAVTSLSIRINQILQHRKKIHVPAGVIFSGDLTAYGQISQFQVGTTYLRGKQWISADNFAGLDLGNDRNPVDANTSPALFIVPGNHDIWRRKDPKTFSRYHSFFPNTYPATWKINTATRPIFIHGVNSTENTSIMHKLARGRISPDQLNELCQRMNSKISMYPNSINIVFLHHPIVSAGSLWGKENELDDYGVVANRLVHFADLILAGHVHKDFYFKKHSALPTHAVVGTASQMFSDRSFFLIDVLERTIEIECWEYNETVMQFVPRKNGSYTFPV